MMVKIRCIEYLNIMLMQRRLFKQELKEYFGVLSSITPIHVIRIPFLTCWREDWPANSF